MNPGALPPWLAMSLFAVAMTALVAVLAVLRRTTRLSAESIRKLFHLGGGAAALSLPWLFASSWPVLVLGFASLALFVLLRVVPVLKAGPGQILQAVPRQSAGEFWFLLGVVTVFAISRNSVVVYSIGILVLAVADTAAAVIGVFYGRHTYEVPGGKKSAEGSSAFLLTAFLSVHVPLLLFTDTGRLETLLIALNTGLLLMLAEADAARGLDNFVLPVLVVVLLELFLEMPAEELGLHTAVIVSLGLLVFGYRNRTTLSPDALIGAALTGYVIWLFGGWRWLVAPVVLFGSYTLLVGRPRFETSRPFHADVLLAIAAPGIVLVTAYAVSRVESLYLPYVGAWAADLAVIGLLHDRLRNPDAEVPRPAVINWARSLAVLVPGVLVADSIVFWPLVASVCSVPVALIFFQLTGTGLIAAPTRPSAWGSVSVSTSAGVIVSFVLCAVLQDWFA